MSVRHGPTLVPAVGLAMFLALPGLLAQPATEPQEPPLGQAQLEQMLAPIALYPDEMLSQVLMASTYPLEVVQADRFVKANRDLTGEALAAQLEKEPWDPSVKSLVNFPDILAMMSDNLDQTVKLGDAFLSQQADVMNTIQNLRAKARAAGYLETNQQQTVSVQPATSPEAAAPVQQVPPPPQVIVIQPAQPQVIYVPQYNPTVVYGAWPYPAYPPAVYYPPGYVASRGFWFGAGVAVGAAWGYAWGNCNWGHHDIDVDFNRNININNRIDRSRYQAEYRNRANTGRGGGWQHDAAHRRGVAYADRQTAQRFRGAEASPQAVAARDAFRGRADAGRGELARGGGVGGVGGGGMGGGRAGGASAGGQFRTGAGGAPTNMGRDRLGASPTRGGALDGISEGGNRARMESRRGYSSRSSSASRSAPRSGGGGAMRGGAGARGGGGRGRR